MNAPSSPEQQEADYLAQLGHRVRHWRGEHGTTRKALAATSGVSERYLAQLEAGQGNISVLLLRKLAAAMDVPIESLVRETRGPERQRVAPCSVRHARTRSPKRAR